MYYVYRFTDKLKNVIYVGRTNNLYKRISAHFSKGHLPKECYQKALNVEYIAFNTYAEMAIYELYLINYYKPEFNIALKNEEESLTIQLSLPLWKKYIAEDFLYIDFNKKKPDSLNTRKNDIKNLAKKINTHYGYDKKTTPDHPDTSLNKVLKEAHYHLDTVESLTHKNDTAMQKYIRLLRTDIEKINELQVV